jgi:hypothetical protein
LGFSSPVKSQSVPASLHKKNTHLQVRDSLLVTWVDSVSENSTEGLIIRKICKGYKILYALYPQKNVLSQKTVENLVLKKRIPLLQVKGNILYDVNYRSRIDTPYAQNNLYQHTLQTRLDFLYKQQYPFKVYVTTRFGNSNLFRRYTDLNFQYNPSDFTRLLKNKLAAAVENYMSSSMEELEALKRQIELKRAKIASLNDFMQKPDLSQKLVEEREKTLFGSGINPTVPQLPMSLADIGSKITWPGKFKFSKASQANAKAEKTTHKADSVVQQYYSFKDSVLDKKRQLDTLDMELEQAEKMYRKLKTAQQLKTEEWRKEINGATDVNFLVKKLHQLNMPDTLLPKGYKTLSALKSFNIGRSMVNYSELSVKDINITGVQVEFNPHYYYAFAAGRVDYRFRDYLVTNRTPSHQYVGLVRFGKGVRNGNHLIFTYYSGKRQFFNSAVAVQGNIVIPEYKLAGITIEGFYKINRNISLVAEVAKSTMPYYSLDSIQRKKWSSAVTRFNDHSNEAYSAKLNAYFPKTLTRVTGNLRYTGANFQSFSTFTTGTAQTRWMVRLEQLLFKKQLSMVSAVQQNDYSNPFVTTAYKSSSVLASLQASLRIKKWPVFSVGYYPSYQLTKTGDNSFAESRYYTLLANSGYFYRIHGTQLSTYIVYSRFYNQSADSGFVYFNSKNFLISQNVFMKKMSMLVNASLSTGIGYNRYTLENNEQFTINRLLTAGGGIKMVKHSLATHVQWGYAGNITLKVPKLGDFQLMMDKGFIPGSNQQLVENKTGRLTYYKTF